MNKEELLKEIMKLPKAETINPISAYNSINIEDLANAVDRFKKVPTYDELLKENQKYKEVIDKAIEYIEKESSFLSDDEYELFNKKELLDILKEVE